MSGQSSTPETIFAQAIGIAEADARAAFLDGACGNDLALRGEVERLVSDHFRAGSFLESPPPGLTAAMDASELREKPGSTVGPYKLLEQIGEGGMGVVFMAEQQEPVRRKVAIKLIKPGMDTRQVIARFEAERQALAVMDHPNIARVLDAGATPSGHPYFVMELVRGEPITSYCDQNGLSIRERLELFTSVCQAIQHAHTKGIIHRDIKPTNVLVTRQDGRATIKVIDFGVAKAMGQQLTEKTLFTNFSQMIGTPLYMSPEQAERSGVDIDTRSDIYSLGVLLYELLTGSTPVDAEQLKQAAFDEIRRIIREEEPPTPSSRISGSHTLPAIAAHRQIEPARLSKLVRGELDWIVMKALDKDRGRRYETANAFAADLSHYLSDDPVQACPPSTTYRLSKFARRNRVAITTAAVVAAALVAATLVSTWQAVRAEQARAAEAEQRRAAEAARLAEAQQRKVAEAERSEAEKQRAAAEANYQKAKAAVDRYFTLVSESTLFEIPGLQPLRKDLLESALEFYEGAAHERTNDPAVLVDIAATQLRISSVYLALNRADDYIAAVRHALDAIDRLQRDHPNAHDHESRLAGFWQGTRWTQIGMDVPRDPLGALQTMKRFENTWQDLVERYPSNVAFQSDLGYVQATIGLGLTAVNRFREGIPYFRKSVATLEKVVGESPQRAQYRADLADTLMQLARNLNRVRGNSDEVISLLRRAVVVGEGLVAEFPGVPTYKLQLVQCLTQLAAKMKKNEPDAARDSLRRAMELSVALVDEFPSYQPYIDVWITTLADSASFDRSPDDASQFEEVIQEVSAACEARIKLRPMDRTLRDEYALYCFRSAQRSARFAALAERLHRRAGDLHEALLRDFADQPEAWKSGVQQRMAQIDQQLGLIARGSGRPADALKHLDKAAAEFEELAVDVPKRSDLYRDYLADTLLQKVGILAATGRAEDAEKTGRRVMEIYDALLREFPTEAAYRKNSANAAIQLVRHLATSGNLAQAEAASRQAIDMYARLAAANAGEPDYRRLGAACQRHLARIQAEANHREEAATSYQIAIDSYQKIIADFPRYADLWRVYHGLAQALDATNQPAEADEARQRAVALVSDNAHTLNNLAWGYATAVDPDVRDASLAVALAEKSFRLDPKYVVVLNTLGVAYYRAGDWQEAIEWLTKAHEVDDSNVKCIDWFFLAMAHWQLGHQDEAREWLSKALAWMAANPNQHIQELPWFKAEAQELIENKQQETVSVPERSKDVM